MKIAILTIYYGEKFINDTKYGRQTIIDYCIKHGYDFINDPSVIDFNRPIEWSKILLIQKYLEKKEYDYLVWIDADIIILNPEKNIENFIERLMGNNELMYSADFGQWVNNGVIFIKNTDFMLEYFKEVYKHTNEICREQGAMDLLYRNNWNNCKNVCKITQDPTEYNSYWGAYKYGQFIIHFPGCSEKLPGRQPNSLRRMMDLFTPLKMEGDNDHPLDTDETYQERLRWLKEDAENEMKEKRILCWNKGLYLPIYL